MKSKRLQLLNETIKDYHKLAIKRLASLESDMAKRIMYSVIPAVATPEEMQGTGGVVDYNALNAAAEGRKDVLKYGTLACLKELRHFKEGKLTSNIENFIKNSTQDIKTNSNNANYVEILESSTIYFSDHNSWKSNFGGPKWEKISKTLFTIAKLDAKLADLQLNKKDPDYLDNDIQIKKEIVLYLNVFDGLSHNTASILDNILEEESKLVFKEELEKTYPDLRYLRKLDEIFDWIGLSYIKEAVGTSEAEKLKKEFVENIRPIPSMINDILDMEMSIFQKFSYIEKQTQIALNFVTNINELLPQQNANTLLTESVIFSLKNDLIKIRQNKAHFARQKRITKLMDSKELNNPINVWENIKPSLKDSGDIYRYKDWVKKLDPKIDHKINPSIKNAELFFIRKKKEALNNFDWVKKALNQ